MRTLSLIFSILAVFIGLGLLMILWWSLEYLALPAQIGAWIVVLIGAAAGTLWLIEKASHIWHGWHVLSHERARAEREAHIQIDVAPAGSQIIRTITGDYQAVVSEPLHLAPDIVNGRPSAFSDEATRRWLINQAMHATARTPASNSSTSLTTGLLERGQEVMLELPGKVDLLDLLPAGQSTLSNIVLGVTINEAEQYQTVSAPLFNLVHIGVGGSSGWGKSVFLRALAYQLLTAPEPAELSLIDLEATTFAPLATAPRLRSAIADTESQALGILGDLTDELERRKALFMAYPMVEKLSDYNRLAEAPLPVVTLLIDEATALLSDRAVESQIRLLALRARKYGVYVVLGGQDWKATSLDTAIRNQLSTRIQFKAQDGQQSRVLLGTSEAAGIDQVGRAYAVLPGRPRVELQTPYIGLSAIAEVVGDSVPQPPPEPTRSGESDEKVEQDARFVELVRGGMSKSMASLEAYDRPYAGDLVARGKRALGEI